MAICAGLRRLAPALGFAGALFGVPALAQTTAPATPSAQSETAGATNGLGSSHRFGSEAAAAAHCQSDTVVWSSGSGTSYDLPASSAYGKGGGFYACKQEADDAGFHAGN